MDASQYAYSLLLRETFLKYPAHQTNLPYALKGDIISIFQSCLLHKHPRNDSPEKKFVTVWVQMGKTTGDQWSTVSQHWFFTIILLMVALYSSIRILRSICTVALCSPILTDINLYNHLKMYSLQPHIKSVL